MDEALVSNPEPVGDELPPGTVLCQGQYTVQRYLNAGGFGITYLAHDSLGRKVVIKECFPGAMCCRTRGTVRLRSASHGMDFDRVVALFEREARALAQLNHPNIVGVHQIFTDNGTAYMAMDFVDGPDLFDLLETRPEMFAPEEVERILRHLLGALSYVHGNGMLHRDISPDNILLAPGSMPVLIDFGAARERAVRATRVLSRIHTVKDGYSPQEFYLAGSSQQKSSDLYALAATMYHLITGRAPTNSNARLAAVAQDMPDPFVPLTGQVQGYDEAFLAAIDRSLALFAKDRLATADDWLDAISAPSAAVGNGLSAEMQRRISEIVSETSAHVQDSGPAPAPARPAAPDPVAAQRAAEQAYWARVNRELEELRSEIDRDQARQRQQALEEARNRAGTRAPAQAAPHPAGMLGWVRTLFAGRSPRTTPGALNPVKE
ncbi:serine/threonine-protein kinase [Pseudoponticoccus marisrubri]|uniref:Protein kinase domain-containing protein n=1 Tax=Pseudoponticoccus marisrubri TaxID=1685382 RepID=A0A0W7WKT9_9RHOB|nr:serine/threonine-protein kinase [Pseudoponticoccus marisrubri]KUF11096.1 hypothetical protein AVJ23_08540 [Pseudoponticoccus marisrubri]